MVVLVGDCGRFQAAVLCREWHWYSTGGRRSGTITAVTAARQAGFIDELVAAV